MMHPYFFGYGSLVNRTTHDYPQAERARVRGWRRVWQGTSMRKVAYLTAVADSGSEIDGLIAAVPGADWTALDLRERAYLRHKAQADIGRDVQIYAVSAEHADPKPDHPILLSYLDTVIQGYLREFGRYGAQAFFETTAGWHYPIQDDRADPIYPRATRLTQGERAFVDLHLGKVR
ncbi:gamma-glutamylcyclotransferase family protein [Gymnodinialimonas sp. 2305UL16-5]|uniref:gamma-glutamylcyclotransferase family protein n=1 Tax=Gymnodinialimonas mytili TaxID=3126503 RepID=UPI0030A4C2EE